MFQILFPKIEKFLNFEKLLWSFCLLLNFDDFMKLFFFREIFPSVKDGKFFSLSPPTQYVGGTKFYVYFY